MVNRVITSYTEVKIDFGISFTTRYSIIGTVIKAKNGSMGVYTWWKDTSTLTSFSGEANQYGGSNGQVTGLSWMAVGY